MMDFEANVAFNSWAGVIDCFVDALPINDLGFKDLLNEEGRLPTGLPICLHCLSMATKRNFVQASNWKKHARLISKLFG